MTNQVLKGREEWFNMGKNILVVGAHPDDIELGCGGAIAKHVELKDDVYVIVMTNGESGGHTQDRKECMSSLTKNLGILERNIFFGNFPDGYLKDNRDAVNFVEHIIKKFKIKRVYTHDSHDRHQDHRNCSYAVSAAARNVPEIFLFQGPSTQVTFEPHYFIELSEDQMEKKLEALNSYTTQIEKGVVNINWIKNLAGATGSMCNTKYAEAFAINHIIEGN